MTGNCNEKVQNKNLFNKNNTSNILNAYINTSNKTVVNNASARTAFIDCKSNTTYTVSRKSGARFCVISAESAEIGTVGNVQVYDHSASNLTITTGANDKYILVFYYLSTADTLTEEEVRNSIQIEENSTATDYIAHAEQNAPLTLGNIELYDEDKIEISYVNQAGYKKVTGANVIKKCNKYTFDGSIAGDYTFKDDNTNTISVNLYPNQIDQGILKGTNDIPIYCSDFLYVNDLSDTEHLYVTAATPVTGGWKGNTRIYLNKTRLTGYSSSLTNEQKLNLFKTYLTQNPITIAYKSVQSTTTPITDTTLLAQLETLINLKTYKEVTHIDATGADLTPVLEFNYYKDMTTIFDNLEARVELLEN